MKNKQKELPEFNALEYLNAAIALAGDFSFSADGYLEMLKSTPRVKSEVGNLYITLNGSLVLITRQHKQEVCPACGVVHGSNIPEVIQSLMAGPSEEHETPPRYVVTVLKGGHSRLNLAGAAPGADYYVDENGLIIISNLNAQVEAGGLLLVHQVALVGMCLARKTSTTLEQLAHTEKTVAA